MSNEMNNMFSGLFQMPTAGQETEKPEAQQPDAQRRQGPSESTRKAYAAYRKAVTGYPGLLENREKAIANLKQTKAQHNTYPTQLQKLQKERDGLAGERDTLNAELRNQRNGTGAVLQVKNVACDQNTAQLILKSRGSMTASQRAFLEKPHEEVCSGQVVCSAENLESLESSFRGTALYQYLATGVSSAEIVTKALGKLTRYVLIVMMALFLLGKLTESYFFHELTGWICGLSLASIAVGFAFKFMSNASKMVRLIVILIVGWMGITFGSALAHEAVSGEWMMTIIMGILLSFMVKAALKKLVGSQKVVAMLQKVGFFRDAICKEVYAMAESDKLMNEALYCYCHHDAIMDYFRANSRKSWIAQLENAVKEKERLLAAKERELTELKRKSDASAAQIQAAQNALNDADAAVLSANRSIREWDGQPDAEMAGNQFLDMICLEGKADNTVCPIITHNKKPIAFYYSADTYGNPVSQAGDDLVRMVNGFMRLNPDRLMKVSVLNMAGGDLPNSMIVRMDTVDWSQMKGPGAVKNTEGKVFYAGSRAEMEEVRVMLDEHVLKIKNFIMSHRQQLRGGAGIEQINKLLAEDNQSVHPYHVLMIMVPRDKEQNNMNAEAIINYVRDAEDCHDKGILPVFFVNKNSIHEQWKNVITTAATIIR